MSCQKTQDDVRHCSLGGYLSAFNRPIDEADTLVAPAACNVGLTAAPESAIVGGLTQTFACSIHSRATGVRGGSQTKASLRPWPSTLRVPTPSNLYSPVPMCATACRDAESMGNYDSHRQETASRPVHSTDRADLGNNPGAGGGVAISCICPVPVRERPPRRADHRRHPGAQPIRRHQFPGHGSERPGQTRRRGGNPGAYRPHDVHSSADADSDSSEPQVILNEGSNYSEHGHRRGRHSQRGTIALP